MRIVKRNAEERERANDDARGEEVPFRALTARENVGAALELLEAEAMEALLGADSYEALGHAEHEANRALEHFNTLEAAELHSLRVLPPVLVRSSLAADKRYGTHFDRAWKRAMRWIRGDSRDTRSWREALEWARPFYEDAYNDEGSLGLVEALVDLKGELDALAQS